MTYVNDRTKKRGKGYREEFFEGEGLGYSVHEVYMKSQLSSQPVALMESLLQEILVRWVNRMQTASRGDLWPVVGTSLSFK